MTKQPSGFFQSDAILARNLFGATPADAVRFVSVRISRRIVSAVSVAVGMPVSSCVTSKYASSSDSGSTSGVGPPEDPRGLGGTRRGLLEIGWVENGLRAGGGAPG